MKPTRTALYRFWDADGRLLYIGITEMPEKRWAAHAGTKSWWSEVARKDLEWFENREDARAGELAAIRTEHALHNVADSPWAPKSRELHDNEAPAGAGRLLGFLVDRVKAEGSFIYLVRPDRKRTRVVALAPVELVLAIEAAGGPDAALKLLRREADDGPA